MPEEIPHLKSDIAKPNPIDLERYEKLIRKTDEEYELIEKLVKEAEEEVKLFETQVKQESFARFTKEQKDNLREYARILAKMQLLHKLEISKDKDIRLRVLDKAGKDIAEMLQEELRLIVEDSSKKHVKNFFERKAPRLIRVIANISYKLAVKIIPKVLSLVDGIKFGIELSPDIYRKMVITTMFYNEYAKSQILTIKLQKELDLSSGYYFPPGTRYSHPLIDEDLLLQLTKTDIYNIN